MISGNIENTPLRQIEGWVELCNGGSTPVAVIGNPVIFSGAEPYTAVDIQLTSNSITDFSNIGTRYSKNILDVATAPRYHTFTSGCPMTVTKTATGFIAQYDYALESGWTRLGYYIGKVEDFIGKTITVSAKCRGNHDAIDMTNLPWLTIAGTDIEPSYADTLNSGSGYIGGSGTKTAFTQTTASKVGQPVTYTFTGEETNKYILVDFLLTYGKFREDGDAIEYYDIQVEYGDTGTEYEPYYALPIPVEVKRTGKNLWDFKSGLRWQSVTTAAGSAMARYSYIVDLPPSTYTISAALTGKAVTGNDYIYAYLLDNTNTIISSAKHLVILDKCYSETITLEQGQKLFVCSAGHKVEGAIYQPLAETVFYDYADIQIEQGQAATSYEPYQEQIATADASGKVEGITALNGTNFISSNADVNIVAKYKPNTDTITFTADAELQSITVDRLGANKFFGFGVCQKATIQLLDSERAITINNGGVCKLYFDGVTSFPWFYVNDIKRDENTNKLTVTGYDALYTAEKHTVKELDINAYTIAEFVKACAKLLGVYTNYPADISEFNLSYDSGANFDGTETIRAALDAVAEVTQTVYFMNYENKLTFIRLDKFGAPVYNIDKTQYFTLNNKDIKRLGGVAHITELGDNISAIADDTAEIQYIRNNPFWELREDVGALVDNALTAAKEYSINQFNCSWRGNYLLEIGDKISIVTKDDGTISAYLLNDTVTYNGGYKQVTKWEYEENEKAHTNPTSLGEVLKQTSAKVDKQNQQIELVASNTDANSAAIAAIQLNTNSISASVSSLETQVNDASGLIEELTTKVSATMTEEQVVIAIENKLSGGVDSVETRTGFTFNEDGLTVSNSESDISTTITEDGMTVSKGSTEVLTANNQGVKAIDLHAETYLLIGKNSRFEDYDNNSRTGCFWIGG